MWRKSDTKLRNCPFSHDHIIRKTQNSQGGLAQVVERSICIREAPGSIPGFSIFQNIIATVAKGVLVIPQVKITWIRFSITCGFDFWHLKMCRDPGLNQGPSDLQSDALPTELSRLAKMEPGRWVLDVNCRFLRFSHNNDRCRRSAIVSRLYKHCVSFLTFFVFAQNYSFEPDLNQRPRDIWFASDLQSPALPTELSKVAILKCK